MKHRKGIDCIISLVLVTAVMITLVGNYFGTGITKVYAEEKKIDYPFGYESSDVFVSDMLLGQSTDSDGKNLGFSNFAYNPVLKQYTYKTIAEGIIDNQWLMGSSVFWKNAESCLDGDFVDLVTWKQVMYETLIMDWLTYQFESDEFKSEFQKESANYGWKITKYLLKKGDFSKQDDLGSMSVEKASSLLDEDFYKQNEILGKAQDFNKNVSDVVKVAKTGIDYYKQFSKVLAAKGACKSKIEFLKQVKQVSDNEDLCKAIDVVIDKLNMSSASLAFNEGGFTMLKTICSEAWDLLVKEVPILSEVKLGIAGMDWLFNTSNANSKRIELVILYTMNADFTIAYQKIRENFTTNKTEDNAIVFNNSFLDYVLWEAYASNITEKYIAESLLEGAWNQVVNLFSNKNIQTYNDLKNMIDGDISVCNGWYNIVGKYYNTYNNILLNNEYMSWYNDNLVHVTGVHFEREEVEIGLEDNNAFFWENVIVTPENATDASVTYQSSDESIVSVKDKQTLDIEVHKTGTAIITVTTNDGGYTDTLKINVVEGHGKDGFYLKDPTTGKLKAGDRFIVGLLKYEVISDNKVEVCDCDTSATSINIPKYISYRGYSYEVVSIGYEAFMDCSSLVEIIIPDSVTSIDGLAFSDSGLIDVSIPNSVTSIKYGAFAGCSNLTEIAIPDSVTSIASSTFYRCSSLKTVTISNSVTSIENGAFMDCINLKGITIPNSVTSIEYKAFENCSSLTTIIIPDSVTNIDWRTFYGCNSLTTITIPKKVTSIGNGAFESCSSLKTVTISNSVTSIGDSAFRDCINLKGIVIPNSVTSIGISAFENCNGLTNVTIPNSVTDIGSWAFQHCSSLTSITIPDSVTSIEYDTFDGCNQLTMNVYANSYALQYAKENNIPYKIIDETVNATSVKLNQTSASVYKNKTLALKATITPNNATDKTLTWSSSNSKVATVSSSGVVKGISAGTATITVKTNNGKIATCKVIVKNSEAKKPVTQLTYSKLSNKSYTGKQQKPALSVKNGSKTLKKNTDYILSYGTNKYTGRAWIKVTGKGNYTGTTYRYFYIVPKKVMMSSAKSSTKKKITVKYKKSTGSSGYQIAYKKKGTSKWYYKYTTKLSYNLTKLSSKKYYYVKIRGYKTVSGKKYYGSYSSLKTVKAK